MVDFLELSDVTFDTRQLTHYRGIIVVLYLVDSILSKCHTLYTSVWQKKPSKFKSHSLVTFKVYHLLRNL